MTTHLGRLQREHAPTASQTEALAAGRAERIRMPRQAHRDYEAGARDPLAILDEQKNQTLVDDLISLRMGRLIASLFSRRNRGERRTDRRRDRSLIRSRETEQIHGLRA